MEWMLQVVDEVEDALNHAGFRVVDFSAEIGLVGCGLIATIALATATLCGAAALVLSGAFGMLAAAAFLKALKAPHRLLPPANA